MTYYYIFNPFARDGGCNSYNIKLVSHNIFYIICNYTKDFTKLYTFNNYMKLTSLMNKYCIPNKNSKSSYIEIIQYLISLINLYSKYKSSINLDTVINIFTLNFYYIYIYIKPYKNNLIYLSITLLIIDTYILPNTLYYQLGFILLSPIFLYYAAYIWVHYVYVNYKKGNMLYCILSIITVIILLSFAFMCLIEGIYIMDRMRLSNILNPDNGNSNQGSNTTGGNEPGPGGNGSGPNPIVGGNGIGRENNNGNNNNGNNEDPNLDEYGNDRRGETLDGYIPNGNIFDPNLPIETVYIKYGNKNNSLLERANSYAYEINIKRDPNHSAEYLVNKFGDNIESIYIKEVKDNITIYKSVTYLPNRGFSRVLGNHAAHPDNIKARRFTQKLFNEKYRIEYPD